MKKGKTSTKTAAKLDVNLGDYANADGADTATFSMGKDKKSPTLHV